MKVAMNMFASANYEVRPVAAEPKPVPAPGKPKANSKSNFESLLQKTNHKKAGSQDTSAAEPKPPVTTNSEDNQLIMLLTDYQEQLGLLPDGEVNQEQLLQQLSMLLEAMGSSDVKDLDAEGLDVLKTRLAELIKQNGTIIPPQDMKGETQPEIPPQLLTGKSDLTLDNQTRVNDGEKFTARAVQDPVKAEPLTNLVKLETKPKKTEGNRLAEDKAEVKAENQNSTDIKRLMAAEANRFSGVRPSATTGNSSLIPEQTAENTNEDEGMPNINLSKLEATAPKVDNRVFTMANNKPLEAKELIDQIVKKAEILLKQNASEIKIDLKPEFLGKMTIKIAVEEGILTARFLTENHQVKNLLESNLNTLRQSLEAQGIKVEKTEVNVQLNNGGLFDGSENGRESKWERPNYVINYQSQEHDEDYLPITTDLISPDNRSDVEAYQPYENASLSFLI